MPCRSKYRFIIIKANAKVTFEHDLITLRAFESTSIRVYFEQPSISENAEHLIYGGYITTVSSDIDDKIVHVPFFGALND